MTDAEGLRVATATVDWNVRLKTLESGLLSAAGDGGRDPDVGGVGVALGRRRAAPRGAAARCRLDGRARASTGWCWDRTGRGRRPCSTWRRPSRIPRRGRSRCWASARRGRHAEAARVDRDGRAGPGATNPRPLHGLRGGADRGDRKHRAPARPDHRGGPRAGGAPDGRNRRRARCATGGSKTARRGSASACSWRASLMDEPDLLLLDEPSSGLDLPSRERLIASLDAMAEANADLPTVLVTHHLEEIPATTTHALLLRDGAIVAAGPIADVLTSERRLDHLRHRGRGRPQHRPLGRDGRPQLESPPPAEWPPHAPPPLARARSSAG